jgi:hypothetical protein
MAPVLTRVMKEQLRKRFNNLHRWHNEFWLLYKIKIWLIMELADGQIVMYNSYPDRSLPSAEYIVRVRRRFDLE